MTTARSFRLVSLCGLILLIVTSSRVVAQEREVDLLLLDASLNGVVADVERALDEGADPNVFRSEDGWTPLMLAAMNGYTDIARILLEHNADPNLGNDDEGTPLCVASGSFIIPADDQDAIIDLLLEAGADLYGSNGSGMVALMYAAREGKVSTIKRLLDAGADVNYQDVREWSPLVLAAMNEQTDAAQVLLEAGADPNVQSNETGWTPLREAAENNNTEFARILLEAGAEPNGLPFGADFYPSPLGFAAQNDNVEFVRLLLDRGALPNYSDGGYTSEDGVPRTPLDWAKERGASEIEELLRDAGALDDIEETYAAMLKAVREDDADEFEELMERKVDPRRYLVFGEEEGVTLLNEAAMRGNLEIVQTILSFPLRPHSWELYAAYETAMDNGFELVAAEIVQFSPGDMAIQAIYNGQTELLAQILDAAPETANYVGSDQQIPLHMAADAGDIQMVAMLLEAGAVVDYADRWGETPLFPTVRNGSTEIGEVLLEWGADIEARTKNSLTPLHAAVLASQVETIQWLLSHDATLYTTDDRGWNALHFAAWNGSASTAELLLSLGMDPNARDDRGRTPLQIATESSNSDVIAILENAMSGW